MKKRSQKQLLIFTDLDGTLLDHHNYDWRAAAPALALAKEMAVPIIPCTSKTYAECQKLVKTLDLDGPFIFENGGGVALPLAQFTPPEHPRVELDGGYWTFSFGTSYSAIRRTLESLRAKAHYLFRGIGDMSLEQICESTGLGVEDAKLARMRRHGEPILWLDNAKSFEQFTKDINRAELKMTRGGRFIHILGAHDKGDAILWLARMYHQRDKRPPFVIAAGDSSNDLPMLKIAHAAVIVRPPHQAPLELEPQSPEQLVITTDLVGPSGWNQAITQLLNAETSHG